MIGPDPLLGLLLRRGLNRAVVVAILRSTAARIWRLVLCATVRRGCERDLELSILIRAVRHHGGVGGCFLGVDGGIASDVVAPPRSGDKRRSFNECSMSVAGD